MGGASCIVCPCCNGKMGHAYAYNCNTSVDVALEDGMVPSGMAQVAMDKENRQPSNDDASLDGFRYPRSLSIGEHMSRDEYLNTVCRAANDANPHKAKCLIEFDRYLWAKEQIVFEGGEVKFLKLAPESCSPKHYVVYAFVKPQFN